MSRRLPCAAVWAVLYAIAQLHNRCEHHVGIRVYSLSPHVTVPPLQLRGAVAGDASYIRRGGVLAGSLGGVCEKGVTGLHHAGGGSEQDGFSGLAPGALRAH
eukprot:414685-Prorocentrum_minimum.AAC.2